MHLIFNKNSKKTYSFRKRIILIFILVTISFFVVFTWISAYFTQILRERTYQNVHDTLEVYNQQLTTNLDKLIIFMYEMSSYSFDMMEVFTTKDVGTIYNRIIRTKELLDYSIPSFTEIDGMFLYVPLNDTFILSSKYLEDVDVTFRLKALFRNNYTDSTINTYSWYSEKISGKYFLFRIIYTNGAYIGTWANVERLTSTFSNISALNGNIVYVNNEGKPLSDSMASSFRFPVNLSMSTYHTLDTNEGKSLLVMNTIDYCDYFLAALIPLENIDNEMNTFYNVMTIILVFLILFLILFFFSITQFITKPIQLLENAAMRLRKGNFEQTIPEDMSSCQEIIDIDTTFNKMIEEIQHLRIDIYEENIAKSEIELQYLKSQMAPHFLINCLFSMMNLAEEPEHNRDILHHMIETLAGHLRYTLTDRTNTELREELYYVENYIELTKLRFPGCLTYETVIDQNALDATVFPLILLMLTENTIKYNMVMGEPLVIKITAQVIESDEGPMLCLTHIDSGEGFTEAILESFREFTENQRMQTADVTAHLGIPNVAKRLWILYKSSGKIDFRNEPGWGARIDIQLPYIPYDPKHTRTED